MPLKVGDQGLSVLSALFGLPQTVELQAHILEPELLPQSMGHQNQLCVKLWASKSNGFGAHLMKLPVASPLRSLMPEHGAHVVKPSRRIVEQVVLNHASNNACGCLGTQGELLSIQSIFKGVHLFFNDVGHLPQAADKKGRGLHDRCSNVLIGVAFHERSDLALKPLPKMRLFG